MLVSTQKCNKMVASVEPNNEKEVISVVDDDNEQRTSKWGSVSVPQPPMGNAVILDPATAAHQQALLSDCQQLLQAILGDGQVKLGPAACEEALRHYAAAQHQVKALSQQLDRFQPLEDSERRIQALHAMQKEVMHLQQKAAELEQSKVAAQQAQAEISDRLVQMATQMAGQEERFRVELQQCEKQLKQSEDERACQAVLVQELMKNVNNGDAAAQTIAAEAAQSMAAAAGVSSSSSNDPDAAAEVLRLQREIDIKDAQLDEQIHIIKEMEEMLEDDAVHHEVEQMKAVVLQAEETVIANEMKMLDMEQNIKTLQSTVQERDQQIAQIQEQLEECARKDDDEEDETCEQLELQEQVECLEKTIKRKDEKLAALQLQIMQASDQFQVELFEKESKASRSMLEWQDQYDLKMVEKQAAIEQKLQLGQEEYRQLLERHSQLEKELARSRAEQDAMLEKQTALEKQLQEMEQQDKTQQDAHAEQIQFLEQQQEKNAALEERLKYMQQQDELQQKESAEQVRLLEQLQEDKVSLEKQVQDMKDQQLQVQCVQREEAAKLSHQLEQVQEQNVILEKQRQDLEQQQQAYQDIRAEQATLLEKLQEKNVALEKQLQDVQQQNQQEKDCSANQTTMMVEQLQEKNAALEKQLEQFQTQQREQAELKLKPKPEVQERPSKTTEALLEKRKQLVASIRNSTPSTTEQLEERRAALAQQLHELQGESSTSSALVAAAVATPAPTVPTPVSQATSEGEPPSSPQQQRQQHSEETSASTAAASEAPESRIDALRRKRQELAAVASGRNRDNDESHSNKSKAESSTQTARPEPVSAEPEKREPPRSCSVVAPTAPPAVVSPDKDQQQQHQQSTAPPLSPQEEPPQPRRLSRLEELRRKRDDRARAMRDRFSKIGLTKRGNNDGKPAVASTTRKEDENVALSSSSFASAMASAPSNPEQPLAASNGRAESNSIINPFPPNAENEKAMEFRANLQEKEALLKESKEKVEKLEKKLAEATAKLRGSEQKVEMLEQFVVEASQPKVRVEELSSAPEVDLPGLGEAADSPEVLRLEEILLEKERENEHLRWDMTELKNHLTQTKSSMEELQKERLYNIAKMKELAEILQVREASEAELKLKDKCLECAELTADNRSMADTVRAFEQKVRKLEKECAAAAKENRRKQKDTRGTVGAGGVNWGDQLAASRRKITELTNQLYQVEKLNETYTQVLNRERHKNITPSPQISPELIPFVEQEVSSAGWFVEEYPESSSEQKPALVIRRLSARIALLEDENAAYQASLLEVRRQLPTITTSTQNERNLSNLSEQELTADVR